MVPKVCLFWHYKCPYILLSSKYRLRSDYFRLFSLSSDVFSPTLGTPLHYRKSQRKGKVSPVMVNVTAVNPDSTYCWESEARGNLCRGKAILHSYSSP